jgi:proton-dependent oligopeptide transporter, POT family
VIPASSSKSAASSQGHPQGLYVLFGAEAWERFSYYGMRALLVLYLTKSVGMTKPNALEIYGIYTGLVYITPLIGGYLADKFLGRRKAVLIGGIVMALGHIAMAFPSLLYVALALLIAGNGFFKPNISTMVGGLYSEGDNRRDGAFTIFYMGINLGALWSPIVCGTLGESIGWHFGFSAAAIGMLLGLFQFGWGQKSLGSTGMPPGRIEAAKKLADDANESASTASGPHRSQTGTATADLALSTNLSLNPADYTQVALWSGATVALAWLGTILGPKLGAALAAGGKPAQIALFGSLFGALIFGLFRGANAAEAKKLTVIIVLVMFNIFFWMGFEQAGGTMTIFADEKSQLNVGPVFLFLLSALVGACTVNFYNATKGENSGQALWKTLSGMFVLLTLAIVGMGIKLMVTGGTFELKASLLQAVNPMVIVALAPSFSKMWEWIDSTKYRLATPAKMAIGMLVLGLGFVVLYIGQKSGEASGVKISAAWLISVYVIHTLGELCLSPIGLSMVTKLAPIRVASLAMGAWLGSSAVANYLAGVLESKLESTHIPIFAFLIGSSCIPAVLLLILTPWLKSWMGESEAA